MTEAQRARAAALYGARRYARKQPLIDRQRWRALWVKYCVKFTRLCN
jgi:hypothetical protein